MKNKGRLIKDQFETHSEVAKALQQVLFTEMLFIPEYC